MEDVYCSNDECQQYRATGRRRFIGAFIGRACCPKCREWTVVRQRESAVAPV